MAGSAKADAILGAVVDSAPDAMLVWWGAQIPGFTEWLAEHRPAKGARAESPGR